jgi:hypothetical protein
MGPLKDDERAYGRSVSTVTSCRGRVVGVVGAGFDPPLASP